MTGLASDSDDGQVAVLAVARVQVQIRVEEDERLPAMRRVGPFDDGEGSQDSLTRLCTAEER